jgi:hypothetical protein
MVFAIWTASASERFGYRHYRRGPPAPHVHQRGEERPADLDPRRAVRFRRNARQTQSGIKARANSSSGKAEAYDDGRPPRRMIAPAIPKRLGLAAD